MSSTIITKNSSTASAVPLAGDLVKGELAINVTDKKLYTKDNSAAVVKVVGSLGNQEANAVAITGGSIAGITDLAVADGGTGASTAANARTNLGAAASGANSDITSLSGLTTALSVAQGGTGVTTSTGTGSVVLSNSPTLVAPALGTPSSATLTNATGLPVSTGISGLGTGVATFLATPSSANLASAVSDETGTGALVFANSPTLVTPALGTPASGVLTNTTGLPLTTGVTGTLPVANGGTGVTTATGTGSVVLSNSPTLVTPALGTPSALVGTNITGTAANFNINGTVGATTPASGSFTTLTTSSTVTHNGGTANGVAYLNGSKVLTTGSALTFDGTTLTATGNAVISDNSSNAALRITQTGAGNALLVEDSANPDSTPFIVNSAGQVLIGTSSLLPGATAGSLSIVSEGSSAPNGNVNGRRYSTDTSGLTWGNGKARGTFASPTIVQSGDSLGTYQWQGYDGAAFLTAAGIAAEVDGTPGTNDMPGRLVFSTTADGASSATERMRINNAGNVGIGSNNPTERLTVTGNAAISGVITEAGVAMVVQTDIGTAPNEIPLNQYLGKLAYEDVVGLSATLNPAPTIASAATIQPLAPITFVSGTTTINTITVPAEFLGGGQITLIPTGLWSTGTSGNIAIATTGVVSRALILTYDAVTTKWYPSY